MKCPYCAEEDLKDEAIVCRHCGRDLGMHRAFAARITSLEKKLSELAIAIVTLQIRSVEATSPAVTQPARPSVIQVAVGVVVAVAAAIAIYFLMRLNWPVSWDVRLRGAANVATANIAAGLLGYWIGLKLGPNRGPLQLLAVYVTAAVAFTVLFFEGAHWIVVNILWS